MEAASKRLPIETAGGFVKFMYRVMPKESQCVIYRS